MRRNDITSYEEQQRSEEAAIECEAVTVDAPDDACRGITRRSVVKGAAAAVFALATVPLWRWVTSPVRAYADENSDAILAQAKELRNQLIAAQSQYYEAIARQEAANTQKADAEKVTAAATGMTEAAATDREYHVADAGIRVGLPAGTLRHIKESSTERQRCPSGAAFEYRFLYTHLLPFHNRQPDRARLVLGDDA